MIHPAAPVLINQIEDILEDPVHHEIGISSDGRCEVKIAVRTETEMTNVLGAVERQLKRSEHLYVKKLP